METINLSDSITDLSSLVEKVNQDHLPRLITTLKGDGVLLSKKDWESLQETLYLQSIPGFVDQIKDIEKANDWVSEAEFMEELDGMEN